MSLNLHNNPPSEVWSLSGEAIPVTQRKNLLRSVGSEALRTWVQGARGTFSALSTIRGWGRTEPLRRSQSCWVTLMHAQCLTHRAYISFRRPHPLLSTAAEMQTAKPASPHHHNFYTIWTSWFLCEKTEYSEHLSLFSTMQDPKYPHRYQSHLWQNICQDVVKNHGTWLTDTFLPSF